MLEARGLTKSFGAATPIRGLDAVFSAGRLYAVTGPSGSGKTTLLHLLAGLDVPEEGEVLVDGVSLSGLDRTGRAELRRTRLAFVGQTAGLAPFLGALLAELARSSGVTVVCATHDPLLIEQADEELSLASW